MAIQDSTFPLHNTLFSAHNTQSETSDDEQSQNAPVDTNDVMVTICEDLCWSNEELTMLLHKETNQKHHQKKQKRGLGAERVIEWTMRAVKHYRFTPTTAFLAVDYFDRFMTSTDHQIHHLQPCWALHLLAVACLSLAVKVEETRPLLLLDLQVEGVEFMFEARTIQRMELLVLSSLQWRMHPVTPFSFIDHFLRHLGLKLKPQQLQVDFWNQCSHVLMSLISNCRWSLYLPSALAVATMIHVMDQLQLGSCSFLIDFHSQIDKEKVGECYKLIQEMNISADHRHKRKQMETQVQVSCSKVVVDAYLISSDDTLDDPWDLSQATTTPLELPQLPFNAELLPEWRRTRLRLSSPSSSSSCFSS